MGSGLRPGLGLASVRVRLGVSVRVLGFGLVLGLVLGLGSGLGVERRGQRAGPRGAQGAQRSNPNPDPNPNTSPNTAARRPTWRAGRAARGRAAAARPRHSRAPGGGAEGCSLGQQRGAAWGSRGLQAGGAEGCSLGFVRRQPLVSRVTAHGTQVSKYFTYYWYTAAREGVGTAASSPMPSPSVPTRQHTPEAAARSCARCALTTAWAG